MPDQAATMGAGLFTTGKTRLAVPLAGVAIEADVRSLYARVVVAHRYVNQEADPIEAVYVFPLDEGAAVCAFEALVDGTLVVEEVHERDRAFEIYDDAMVAGHGAFLLDEERPDVFQASIGNLPPGKEVTAKLTYVTELAVNDGRLRFVIPTTVSPRYAPAQDTVGTGRPASEALNPPVHFDVPYGLHLSVRVGIADGVMSIESPSHPVAMSMDEGRMTVSLAQRDAALDRDFVLSIEAPALAVPQVLVECEGDGSAVVGVAFAPSFATTTAPAELIFVVDRSGSMQGDSIAEVRNALQLCLRSMTPGCRFNIVGFGATHEALFSESRAYNEASLSEATAHVAGLEANLGGTELLPALQFVLERKAGAELPRQVVILTDGQVTNTDAVIELARRHAADARVFTFGIGAGASHHLVRGLARAGGGTAEFIHPGERIEPKVLRQLARLLSPALTDVNVEWMDGVVTQSPMKIPPVFAGARLLVYGFVKGQRPSKVRLVAKGPSGPVAFDVLVPQSRGGEAPGGQTPVAGLRTGVGAPTGTVAILAARARIRELEEGSDWLSARGSQQKYRKATADRNEIIALSLRYGLMSRETSFVAVERRETPVIGDVKLRKVPVALTTGWGGLGQPLGRSSPYSFDMPALSVSGAGTRGVRPPTADRLEQVARITSRISKVFHSAPRQAGLSRSRGQRPSGDMHALILLQAADGSWDLTQDLAFIIERSLADLRADVQGATGPQPDVLRAWATALALAWLARTAADRADEWRLIAAKGERWLSKAATIPPGGSTWVEEAMALIADR